MAATDAQTLLADELLAVLVAQSSKFSNDCWDGVLWPGEPVPPVRQARVVVVGDVRLENDLNDTGQAVDEYDFDCMHVYESGQTADGTNPPGREAMQFLNKWRTAFVETVDHHPATGSASPLASLANTGQSYATREAFQGVSFPAETKAGAADVIDHANRFVMVITVTVQIERVTN